MKLIFYSLEKIKRGRKWLKDLTKDRKEAVDKLA